MQPTLGEVYSRAVDPFIFNLSNKKKYELIDNFDTNAIYKSNSYGPTFDGGHDITISDNCKSNFNS